MNRNEIATAHRIGRSINFAEVSNDKSIKALSDALQGVCSMHNPLLIGGDLSQSILAEAAVCLHNLTAARNSLSKLHAHLQDAQVALGLGGFAFGPVGKPSPEGFMSSAA